MFCQFFTVPEDIIRMAQFTGYSYFWNIQPSCLVEFNQIHMIKAPFSTYCKPGYLLCMFDIFYPAVPPHIFIAALIYQFFFIQFHLLPPLLYHYQLSSCLLLHQLSDSGSSDCSVFLMNPDMHLTVLLKLLA